MTDLGDVAADQGAKKEARVKVNENMTQDEFVAEARALRRRADDAEQDFLEFLYQVEQTPRIWGGAGKTYIEILEGNNLCRPGRYAAYKRARLTLDSAAIDGVGINAVLEAGGLPVAAQAEMLDEARAWEHTNETSISEQSAKSLARDIKTRMATGRHQHKGYLQLVRDNERLAAEVQRLRDENAALRTELKNVKKLGKRAA